MHSLFISAIAAAAASSAMPILRTVHERAALMKVLAQFIYPLVNVRTGHRLSPISFSGSLMSVKALSARLRPRFPEISRCAPSRRRTRRLAGRRRGDWAVKGMSDSIRKAAAARLRLRSFSTRSGRRLPARYAPLSIAVFLHAVGTPHHVGAVFLRSVRERGGGDARLAGVDEAGGGVASIARLWDERRALFGRRERPLQFVVAPVSFGRIPRREEPELSVGVSHSPIWANPAAGRAGYGLRRARTFCGWRRRLRTRGSGSRAA